MDPLKCQVLTIKGTQCSKLHKVNVEYCGLHQTKRESTGPHRFAREQLALKQKFETRSQIEEFNTRRDQVRNDQRAMRLITNEETIAEAALTVRHRVEMDALLDTHRAEIVANGGRDPDQSANMGRDINAMIIQQVRLEGWTRRHWARMGDRNHMIAQIEHLRTRARTMRDQPDIPEIIINRLDGFIISITEVLDMFMARAMQDLDNGGAIRGWGGEEVIPPAQRLGAIAMAVPNPNNALARIANDNQNVHTQLVVEQTKKNVAEILKIPVPEIFKWQPKKLSMTYKTIVMFCHLSPKSAWQFSSMYCSDATIYDLEPGIFGKVVDGVWQYIRSSPDKADLKKILAAELRDNIGMCAQGNLSRMCNVLQGYLEGIGQKESINVILGREFARIMLIQCEADKFREADRVLKEHKVPESEWSVWLDPLKD